MRSRKKQPVQQDKVNVAQISKLDDLDYMSANSFRDLKTNVEYQLRHKEKKIIVVTSANQGEGKSYCALHLARAFAEAKNKVLIIDMDLHRPRMSAQLGISSKPGITNLYEDDTTNHFILNEIDERIYATSCGRSTLNATEVLSSSKVSEFVDAQSDSFDIVIIDSPPIRLTPDSKIIISKFKNVVFVVRDNRTRKFEIEEALNSIKLVSPTLLGMVINYKKYSKKQRKKYGYGYK